MEKNVKTAGVSLIEVMISMVLISLLLMAVASVFPRMSAGSKVMHEAEQAKLIAAEVLDGLQMYSEIGAEQNPTWSVCDQPAAGNAFKPFFDTWHGASKTIGVTKYEVTWGDCKTANTVKTIDVKVNWKPSAKKSGKDHTIKVTGAIR